MVKNMSLAFVVLLSACTGGVDTAAYIANGERLMALGRWEEAGQAFEEAIKGDNLAPPGQAMVYWNIFYAYDHTNNVDKTATALLSFLAVGQDFMWRIKDESDAHPGNLWAKAFKIKEKLMFADVALQSIWVRYSKLSCRDKVFACHYHDKRFVGLYINRIPFCSSNFTFIEDGDFLRADVKCKDGQETYYFIR